MITTDKNTVAFSEKDIPQEMATSTKTNGARRGITDVEAALQEQIQDDRYTGMRSDMGMQFVENLEIPNMGDLWIPGYRVITENLAKEYGLQAAFEDDPFSDLPLDEPQPASGAINGNIVNSFVDGVTGQQKNDVLNSCLLAQLAANVKFDKTQDPINWTKFYGNVLENVGWVIPQFQFRGLRSNQARFTMDAVVIRLLKGLLTQDQMETVQATIDAVKALEEGDRRLRIFSRESTKNSAGDFLVSNVGVSANETLSMKLGAFAFNTSSSVTNILWWSFSGNATSMQVMSTTFVLNEQVYDRVRDAILNKLGNRAVNYIGGLDIGD
ncbi:hypothetical protein ACKFKF_28430 [Phormidesmis sp. 146-12]